MKKEMFPDNCPVQEKTADGTSVGRCWSWLPDGKTCPRHGIVVKCTKCGKTKECVCGQIVS